MSELLGKTGHSVAAALAGVTLIPVVVTWAVALKRVNIAPNSKPIKIAHILTKITPPVFILALVLTIAVRGLQTSDDVWSSVSGYRAIYNLALTAQFVFYITSLLTAMAAYIATYGVLYLALGRWKWWSLIKLDATVGGGIVAVLMIAVWAKNMADLSELSSRSLVRFGYDYSLHWLTIIIDGTLTVVALGAGGVGIWAVNRLNKPDRAHLSIGKIPVVLLVGSFIWLLRCVYALAVDIKDLEDGWSTAEAGAQTIIFPIFGLWTMAAVLGLFVYIIRQPIWSDPMAIPNLPRTQQPQMMAAPAVQYVYLAPGQQPPPQPYMVGQQPPPQMYQQPPIYPHGQQPVVYQTQPYPQQPVPGQPQPIPAQQAPAQQHTQ